MYSSLYEKWRTIVLFLQKGLEVYKAYGMTETAKRALLFIRKNGGVLAIIRKPPGILPYRRKPPHAFSSSALKIAFIPGCDAESVRRYRVTNIAALLTRRRIEAMIVEEHEILRKFDALTDCDVVVFSRVLPSPIIQQCLKILQRMGIITVFEIDDFLFKADALPHIDALRKKNSFEQKRYRQMIEGYDRMLRLSDYFFTTTDFLAQQSQKEGGTAFVVRNGLNETQLKIADEILQAKQEVRQNSKNIVVMGYFSGSPTHEADFQTIVPTLQRLMKDYSFLRLHLGGCLERTSYFQQRKNRVTLLPFVPWSRLPYHIAQTDINLVPLEYDNPFCEGKSELKYFEAGVLEIPTVATATDAFRYAIIPGENGFTVREEKEWEDTLRALIEDQRLRTMVGQKAREHVLRTYTPEIQAVRLEKILREIIALFKKRSSMSRVASGQES